MEIEKVIEDLKAQNLTDEQILSSLEQMLQEGKITDEDLERARQMLGGNPEPNEEDERNEASKLFGLKFI